MADRTKTWYAVKYPFWRNGTESAYEWICQNCDGEFDLDWNACISGVICTAYFELEFDAILFKLRWAG